MRIGARGAVVAWLLSAVSAPERAIGVESDSNDGVVVLILQSGALLDEKSSSEQPRSLGQPPPGNTPPPCPCCDAPSSPSSPAAACFVFRPQSRSPSAANASRNLLPPRPAHTALKKSSPSIGTGTARSPRRSTRRATAESPGRMQPQADLAARYPFASFLAGCIVSPRASIPTNFSMRWRRVFGVFASCIL